MVRLLPFILIPVIIVAGLGYWRYLAGKQSLIAPQTIQQEAPPVEVPKTLPAVSTAEPVSQVNNLKSPSPQASISSSSDSKIKDLESTVVDLKARIAVLEKPTVSSSVAKAPLYIPLGASGGPWLYADWTSLNEYQVSINPDNYADYSSMQMEVNFRIIGSPGKGYVRLYNLTDNSSVASEISTINSSFSILNSATFKLTGGQKLYTIQAKSTESKDLYIQSARIKVNF